MSSQPEVAETWVFLDKLSDPTYCVNRQGRVIEIHRKPSHCCVVVQLRPELNRFVCTETAGIADYQGSPAIGEPEGHFCQRRCKLKVSENNGSYISALKSRVVRHRAREELGSGGTRDLFPSAKASMQHSAHAAAKCFRVLVVVADDSILPSDSHYLPNQIAIEARTQMRRQSRVDAGNRGGERDNEATVKHSNSIKKAKKKRKKGFWEPHTPSLLRVLGSGRDGKGGDGVPQIRDSTRPNAGERCGRQPGLSETSNE